MKIKSILSLVADEVSAQIKIGKLELVMVICWFSLEL